MQKTHTTGGENISGWGWRTVGGCPCSVCGFRVGVGWPYYGKRPAVQVCGGQW